MNKIDSFSGEFRFLSNFWYNPDGYTNEHRFQAAKAASESEYDWVMSSPSPGDAKRRGRAVAIRKDWNDIRLTLMLGLTAKKFKDPVLREKLLATGDAELIEGNTWGDKFWGVCDGEGENWLGKCLMKVRAELVTRDIQRHRIFSTEETPEQRAKRELGFPIEGAD